MKTTHPGVTFHTKVFGGNIYLVFRNPFDGNKQKWKSSLTASVKDATSIAEKISEAIHAPLDKLRTDYPQLVYDILEVEPFDKKMKAAKDAIGAQGPFDQTVNSGPWPVITQKSFDKWTADRKAAEEMLSGMDAMRQQREFWRAKAVRAQAMLGRKISDAEAKSGPRAMKTAMAAFMADRSELKATGQSRYNVGNWLKRFVADVGAETDAQEVGFEQAKAHLEKFRENENLSDIVCYVGKFMAHATHQQFERDQLTKWFKGVLDERKALGKDEAWFWLTKREARAILQTLEDDEGQYWSDAAWIQYGCGFRPEELPLLNTVTFKRGKASIVLIPPTGRRLKTGKSHDAVNVPSMSLEAVKRRVKAGGAILFPFSESKCALAPHLLAKRTPSDIALDLWPPADDHEFSIQYIARLKKAAVKVMKADRAEKVNSKTFRHTCGRELILKHGFERTAAVLRHDVATLRKHYADLKTSDASTER